LNESYKTGEKNRNMPRAGPTGGLWGLSQPPDLQKFRFFCSTKLGNFLTFVTEKKFTPLKNRKIQLSSPKNFAATTQC